jgi:U3 small nucleolar RNA-associated protein 13
VEAVGLLHPDEDLVGSTSFPDRIRFYTGGEKGLVKIWDGREGIVLFTLGKEVAQVSDDLEQQRQIVDAMCVFKFNIMFVKLIPFAVIFHRHQP